MNINVEGNGGDRKSIVFTVSGKDMDEGNRQRSFNIYGESNNTMEANRFKNVYDSSIRTILFFSIIVQYSLYVFIS